MQNFRIRFRGDRLPRVVVIFVTRADGALHREYMDVCSEVATQDSDWVSAAITQHVQP